MRTSLHVLMAAVIGISYAASLREENSTPAIFKADQLMSAVESHCQVSANVTGARRKRQSQGVSENSLRELFSNIIKECLEEPEKVESGEAAEEPKKVESAVAAELHGPCSSPHTVNLTEYWRQDNLGSNIRPINGNYNCDRDLQNNRIWFRFTGAAGSKMRDSCVPRYSCGAHASFWTNAQMPTEVGEVRHVPIYGAWAGSCNWYTWPTTNPLTVKRCSHRENDFVYKVYGTESCYWSFCGMD